MLVPASEVIADVSKLHAAAHWTDTSHIIPELRTRLLRMYPGFIAQAVSVITLSVGRCCVVSLCSTVLCQQWMVVRADKVGMFKPKFVHQMVGPSEQIFGYRDLDVQVRYSKDRLDMCMHVKHGDYLMDTAQPDRVQKQLQPALACTVDVVRDVKEWTPPAYSRPFKPPGTTIVTADAGAAHYHVNMWKCDTVDLRLYHERMETLAMWFIDGTVLPRYRAGGVWLSLTA